MHPLFSSRVHQMHAFDSEELQEVKRFFEWALSYERKGLKIAADAMRDEGRKAFERFLANSPSI
jgi:hypothetical protein